MNHLRALPSLATQGRARRRASALAALLATALWVPCVQAQDKISSDLGAALQSSSQGNSVPKPDQPGGTQIQIQMQGAYSGSPAPRSDDAVQQLLRRLSALKPLDEPAQ